MFYTPELLKISRDPLEFFITQIGDLKNGFINLNLGAGRFWRKAKKNPEDE